MNKIYLKKNFQIALMAIALLMGLMGAIAVAKKPRDPVEKFMAISFIGASAVMLLMAATYSVVPIFEFNNNSIVIRKGPFRKSTHKISDVKFKVGKSEITVIDKNGVGECIVLFVVSESDKNNFIEFINSTNSRGNVA